MRRRVALLLIAASWAHAARGENYLEVHCDPAAKTVTIVPDGYPEDGGEHDDAWYGTLTPRQRGVPEDVTFRMNYDATVAQCLLDERLSVRLKIKDGLAAAWGACGADPMQWLSAWCGRRKWLALEEIQGLCMPEPVSRILVTPDGLTICRRPEPPPEGPQPPETCRVLAAAELPPERDLAEYPLGASSDPEPGTIVVEHGARDPACESMIERGADRIGRARWNLQLPQGAEIVFPTLPESEFPEEGSRAAFDMDNDGKAEPVLALIDVRAHRDRVRYVTTDDAQLVFPPTSSEEPESPPERRRLALEHPVAGERFSYALDLLHARPFRLDGATYFWLSSFYQVEPSVDAVVRLTPDRRIEERCVFRHVDERY